MVTRGRQATMLRSREVRRREPCTGQLPAPRRHLAAAASSRASSSVATDGGEPGIGLPADSLAK